MRRTLLLLALAALPVGAAAQTSASPHGALSLPCATCHGAEGWKPARISPTFAHARKTFPLEGAHAKAACQSCHKQLDFSQAPKRCASCHEDRHNGELGTDCARCHTPRSFVDRPAMQQAHSATRFPLRGAHASVACESCHAATGPGQLRFTVLSLTCAGCHADDARAVRSPDHQSAGFTGDCTSCHTIAAWSPSKFDHGTTQFALTGAHRTATCAGCHADRVYQGKTTACVGCHKADYDRAVKPPHAQGFPTACASCHETIAWAGATFDHEATKFPLTGAHRVADCAGCHGDGVFRGKTQECAGCHRDRFDRTAAPPHAAAGFPTTCATCHGTVAWLGSPFNHTTTRFPLTGAHLAATCANCHGDGVYRGKAQDCASCHLGDYTATSAPPHASSGFSTTCATCHGTTAWLGTPFNHAVTRFPLTGAHLAQTCLACHADNVYRGKPTDCYACHRTRYDATAQPPHATSGIGTACANCHTTSNWPGGTFDHAATKFPLTGSHLAATCSGCHSDGTYRGKSTDCYACHSSDYAATKAPPHAASGFPTTCTTCHSTAAWLGSPFNHSTTAFPLTGAHLAASCVGCHGDGVYKGKTTACVGCHQADYNATTLPAHAANGIGTACATCHTTAAWPGATFDHTLTAFPLTGAHKTATCANCHGDGVYKGKTTDCFGCHQADYTATLNPNHIAAQFPTTCVSCHTTVAWLGAKFDHDSKYFPIYSGKHNGKWSSCATCHTNSSNYQIFTCLTCHLQKDMDDKHKGKPGYQYNSITCYSCHPKGTKP